MAQTFNPDPNPLTGPGQDHVVVTLPLQPPTGAADGGASSGRVWRLPPWLPLRGVTADLMDALDAGLQRVDLSALGQLDVQLATWEWLDFHARLYGLEPRFPGETDETLRERILGELRLPRTTPEAIEQAIERAFPGTTATVFDWTTVETKGGYTIRRWDGVQTWDGSVRFNPGGPYENLKYYLGVLIVRLEGGPYDLAVVRSIVDRFRPAGTLPHYEVMGSSTIPLDGTRILNGNWVLNSA